MRAQTSPDPLERFLSGQELYGDAFTPAEVDAWLKDEEEAYIDLKHDDASDYAYFALNEAQFYRRLAGRKFAKALGMGSAFAHEFTPIASQIGELHVVEATLRYQDRSAPRIPTTYHLTSRDCSLDFPDSSFDLIVCLGVLHHIPTVSRAVRELYRCLKPGGVAIVREPVVSMGDWRLPRAGLTRRERGIPVALLDDALAVAGFEVLERRPCMFSLTSRLAHVPVFGLARVYNSRAAVRLDHALARLFAWNKRYHATHWYQKIRPTAYVYVLTKHDRQRA